MPLDRDGDGALRLLAAGGDRRAFGLLVARHEARLRAFLAHLAGPGLGDELAQDAFVKAWASIASFRGDAQFSSWLAAIGWRCFIDHVRRARGETRRREALAAFAPPAEARGDDLRLDLLRALAALDDAERAALILCDGHGWSHVEAADILRIPLGTLKGTIMRAKRKCRAMLAEAE